MVNQQEKLCQIYTMLTEGSSWCPTSQDHRLPFAGTLNIELNILNHSYRRTRTISDDRTWMSLQLGRPQLQFPGLCRLDSTNFDV